MSVAWFSFHLATSAIVLSTFALANLEGSVLLARLSRALAVPNTATFLLAAGLYSARIAVDPGGLR